MTKAIILYDDEYCHVVNNETGVVELFEGPLRFALQPSKELVGSKKKKITLKDGQYVTISNPYDEKKKSLLIGETEVRTGPLTFCQYPGETLGTVYKARILKNNEAVKVKALNDFDNRKAGEMWMIKGPTVFIPKKYQCLIETVDAINIGENEAVYVQNTNTSELKLVKGPQSYLRNVDEKLYEKKLTPAECEALSIPDTPSSKAYSIQVQKNEVISVIDFQINEEKFIVGPESHILGPYEGIKVLSISAGVPKKEDCDKIAIVRYGPDFMNDSFNVRTKDNAVLELTLTYKWKFILDEKNLDKLFHGDFIGYSCQSMRSRIREAASKYDFEVFHTNSSQILREKLFKDYTVKVNNSGKEKEIQFNGRFFSEYNFLLFELDVKKIRPVDKEIEQLLDQSIKASMKILCNKLNDTAETEAEKEKIESEVEIATLRKSLIEINNVNYTKENVEKAKIEGEALVEQARAQAKADLLLQESRLQIELNKMKETMGLLKGDAGNLYIQFVKAQALNKNVSSATIVPTNTKTLFLGSNTPTIYEE